MNILSYIQPYAHCFGDDAREVRVTGFPSQSLANKKWYIWCFNKEYLLPKCVSIVFSAWALWAA